MTKKLGARASIPVKNDLKVESLASALQAFIQQTNNSKQLHNYAQNGEQKFELGDFKFEGLQIRPDGDQVYKVSKVSGETQSVILRWVNERPELQATLNELREDKNLVVKNCIAVSYCMVLEKNNLMISEFFEKGDVKKYLNTIIDPAEKSQKILIFTEQLLTILIGFSKKNIVWPDLKLTNLLVDDQGELKISDVKALVKAEDLAALSLDAIAAYTTGPYIPKNLFDGVITRDDQKNKKIDFNKLISFQMGLALYEMFVPGFPENPMDKNSQIFIAIKKIIEACTKEDPADRPTLEEVKSRFLSYMTELLLRDKINVLNQELDELLASLEGFQKPSNSIAVEAYTKFVETLKGSKIELGTEPLDKKECNKLIECYTAVRGVVDVTATYLGELADPEKAMGALAEPNALKHPSGGVQQKSAALKYSQKIKQLPDSPLQKAALGFAGAMVTLAITAFAFAAIGPLAAVFAISFIPLLWAIVTDKPKPTSYLQSPQGPGRHSLFSGTGQQKIAEPMKVEGILPRQLSVK